MRASLAATVGAIHNDLMFDYFHSDSSSTVPVLTGIVTSGCPGGCFPIASLYAGISTPQARATGIAAVQAFLPAAIAGLVPAFYDAYFSQPGHFAGGITQFLAAQQARGPYVIDSDNLNIYQANNIIITNRTAFQIDPDTELRNIFGYTHLKTFNTFENDGTPYAIAESVPKGGPKVGVPNLTKQTSDELQLVGKILSNRLAYVTGIYFSDESYDNANDFVALDILLGGQKPTYHYIIKNLTYAGYAQGTYALNDSGLAFTLGTRYTSEKVTKILAPGDSNRVLYGDPAPPGYSYDKSDTYDKLSWSVGLQDQIDDNLLGTQFRYS